MGLLPANSQLVIPFHSRLMVRHGTDRQTERQRDTETDGQTDDGHQRLMPPPYGGGSIISLYATQVCKNFHQLNMKTVR